MRPYAPNTDKGRTVAGADQPRKAAKASAKSQRKAARQQSSLSAWRAVIENLDEIQNGAQK